MNINKLKAKARERLRPQYKTQLPTDVMIDQIVEMVAREVCEDIENRQRETGYYYTCLEEVVDNTLSQLGEKK